MDLEEATPAPIAMTSFPSDGTALVVGDRGGIGAAVAEALAAGGRFAHVLGAHRGDAQGFDLEDEASIARLAETLRGRPPLRLVMVCTGLLHGRGVSPEKSLRQLAPDMLASAFAVNAIGPALLMKHLLPCLATDGKAVFAALSARVGSIGDNRLGGWHAYRASKAALNQLLRTAAIELRRTAPAAICVALHPGTVATPLSAPFAAHAPKLAPRDAARRLLQVVDALVPAQSGHFLDGQGMPIPW